MGPNHEALPPLKLQDIDSIIQSTAEDTLPQVPQTKHLRVLPLQQALGTTPNPVPISNHKALRSRADWVNAMFADISGQLRRHSVISTLLFEGILLQKKTVTGSLILKELVRMPCYTPSLGSSLLGLLIVCVQRSKYDQLGHDRNVATVRVLVPEKAMGEEWQLLWTIKRQRDPNGRKSCPPRPTHLSKTM